MTQDGVVKPSLTIKRRFSAPPEKVFSAWTDAEKMKKWMGPGEIVARHVESDPRPGGRYRIIMQAPSGEEFDTSGVYREVIASEKVVSTVARHGNTSAASVPLALHEAVRDGRIERDHLVMLEAMGGGFTWGSALVRW